MEGGKGRKNEDSIDWLVSVSAPFPSLPPSPRRRLSNYHLVGPRRDFWKDLSVRVPFRD